VDAEQAAARVESVSGEAPQRLVDHVVVDTETHVFVRCWPIETSPQMALTDPFTRTEHSGALLVAEMDRAGVDVAILIGYDGYDFAQFMTRFGSVPADFMGGRGYTRGWAERFPERLRYVTTLREPRLSGSDERLAGELDGGAVGVKIFPVYLGLDSDAPEIRAAFDVLSDRGKAAVFGFEDTEPPQTPSLAAYYEGIGRLAVEYPGVPIQLNHGGNADPFDDTGRALADVVGAQPTILVSTSVLGGPRMEWSDAWRYPFAGYLRKLAAFSELLPSGQIAWGTDWPWFEGVAKYPQLLDAVVGHATFFAAQDRRGYLGGNALRHWGLSAAARPGSTSTSARAELAASFSGSPCTRLPRVVGSCSHPCCRGVECGSRRCRVLRPLHAERLGPSSLRERKGFEMTGVPPEESLTRSGLTRRELLERSAALGAALYLPGFLGSGVASADVAATPRRGGHLRVGMNDGGAGDSLAPWNIPIYSAAARAEQVYERLFKYDAHAVARPRLAQSVESSKKGTVWLLKIRPDVVFHSGKQFTADDVLYSLRYIANPKNKAESLTRLEPIDLSASRKVSKFQVRFVLKRPIGDFPGLLAEKAVWMVPNGKTDFAKTPDGTGPFKFVSWQPGIRAMFTRNDKYWGIPLGKGPWVDSLEIHDITDDTARVNALLGGQVDEIAFMPFVQAKANAGNSAIQIIQAAQPQTNPIYVQMDRKPFTDNRVRLALKYAVDRNAMVRQVELGFGTVGNDLFGKGYPSYNNDLPQRHYDPDRAKSLLKKAGYDRFPFTLPTSNALPGMLESATAFKQQAKAANIDVTLQKLDAGSYFSNNKYLKVPSYQTNWGQSFESQAQDGMLRTSPYNETHWYSAQWAAAFRKAQEITDAKKRNAAYKALQVPIWKTSGYVVFAFYNTVDAASSKVRGIVPNISSGFSNLGAFDFKDHWFAS
jgi:peptide/nickel transport system substrate-binding protein